jgi:hypothetical protein
MASESKFERASRHVAEGRQVVARQRDLIVKIRDLGNDPADAQALLEQFERTLATFEADLRALQVAN